MTRTVEAEALTRFAQLVGETLGLRTEGGPGASLGDVLQRRLTLHGITASVYLELLAKDRGNGEWREVAKALTVSETYFFRNPDQFRAFSRTILPERRRQAGERRLRMLSAGCASGEEPYSVAILLRREHPDLPEVEIEAFDLNSDMIARAKAGIYSEWALRETPEPVRKQYFSRRGSEWVLQDSIRAMVRFREGNIAGEGVAATGGRFDVIFCRNLIMYLTPERAAQAVAVLEEALAPGGYLLLGHAESLRGIPGRLELCHTDDTFYYRRPLEPGLAEAQGTASWVDAIQKAAERVAVLATECAPAVGPEKRSSDWDAAAGLLGQERFQEALQHLDPEGDGAVQLLRAVLLTNGGEIEAAEAACLRILAEQGENCGARYLLGLCREQQNDRVGAREQHRLAIRQDPTFASPHLHLGLLAVSERDFEAARGPLQTALRLLPGEDSSRIALFGGGFDRAALLDLCRAQLRACEAD